MGTTVIYKGIDNAASISNIMDKWEERHPEYSHQIIVTEEGCFIEIYNNATEQSKGDN